VVAGVVVGATGVPGEAALEAALCTWVKKFAIVVSVVFICSSCWSEFSWASWVMNWLSSKGCVGSWFCSWVTSSCMNASGVMSLEFAPIVDGVAALVGVVVVGVVGSTVTCDASFDGAPGVPQHGMAIDLASLVPPGFVLVAPQGPLTQALEHPHAPQFLMDVLGAARHGEPMLGDFTLEGRGAGVQSVDPISMPLQAIDVRCLLHALVVSGVGVPTRAAGAVELGFHAPGGVP